MASIFYPLIPLTYASQDTKGQFLAWPINLTRTSLDCGRKPEQPEETHADTRRMCKLHTDIDPSRESNPGPWSCEAAVLITVPSISHRQRRSSNHRSSLNFNIKPWVNPMRHSVPFINSLPVSSFFIVYKHSRNIKNEGRFFLPVSFSSGCIPLVACI